MRVTELLVQQGYDLPRATQAVRALVANPDDLPQVFTVINALSGGMPKRAVRRLKSSARGAALLARRPDIVPVLVDRAALRAMPEGSLAHAYLRFVEEEGISPEGILSASEKTELQRERDDEVDFLHNRLRDTHDLWHAVTGYHGDIAGEIALLAFNLGQSFNPGIALIVTAALSKGLMREHGRMVLEGFRAGRRAAWLAEQDWESLLPLPLEAVRRRLNVTPVAEYSVVRSAQLREEGVLAKAA